MNWITQKRYELFYRLSFTRTRNFLRYGDTGYPLFIRLEISTACNRRCYYCPQSVAPLKQRIVSPEVWQTFLFRLKEMPWRGYTDIIHFNEPSLVPNSENYIADLVRIGTKPFTASNGDRPDVIEKWINAGIHRVWVTEHPPFKPGWREPLDRLVERYPGKVVIRKLERSSMDNRIGTVDIDVPQMKRCRNSDGMVIDIDGNVLLCCLDYYKTHTFRNIKDWSLKYLWFDPMYERIRKTAQRGEPVLEICKKCLS